MRFILLMLFCTVCHAQALDMRPYFPAVDVTVKMKRADGSDANRYTFQKEPLQWINVFYGYFTPNKPGSYIVWTKESAKPDGNWCLDTYTFLFLADDKQVTEGGVLTSPPEPCYPRVVYGYRTDNGQQALHLQWSPPGGITQAYNVLSNLPVWQQANVDPNYFKTNRRAYSRSALVAVLPTYTQPYGNKDGTGWRKGNGKTYNDVIRVVMYRGFKKTSGNVKVRCGLPAYAVNASGYYPYEEYNSYATELYLAKGVGVIREDMPFVEDGKNVTPNVPNCSGTLFSAAPFTTYVE